MVQPMIRKIKRHGIRCEAMNMNEPVTKVARKTVDESGSSLKFVGGVIRSITLSCSREKSSMLFCRSRMLRKKSLDSSFTGLTVGAGAIGGPEVEYEKVSEESVSGGAGCRAMNEGMRTARRRTARGRTETRYGSRHTNVYMARNESV